MQEKLTKSTSTKSGQRSRKHVTHPNVRIVQERRKRRPQRGEDTRGLGVGQDDQSLLPLLPVLLIQPPERTRKDLDA